MTYNDLKIAFRLLRKHSVYSFINIAGLAIGLSACILILLFVRYERSFDAFHSKNLYRLNEVQKFEGMVASQKVALSMYPMGPTLQAEFPEIQQFTRVIRSANRPLNLGEKRVYLEQMFVVDSNFLDMFDFELLKGDRNTALDEPNTAVLTEATAAKFFGDEDPLGKTLMSYGRDTFALRVTGVLKNVPANSHLQFDALVPVRTIARPQWMENWGSNWLRTYLELAPGAEMAALEQKFPDYLKKYMADDDNWKNYELFLLPLRDVHAMASDIGLDELNYHKFDRSYTNIFLLIALIVLLIASVNFMNLSTARSADRAMEVGVRKSIGASRGQLALQFIGESVLLSGIAMTVAVVLVKLSLPALSRFCDRELEFSVLNDVPTLLAMLAGALGLGILSGIYPALYLSSFQPVKVLKASGRPGRGKGYLRNFLVVSQFACAIFLIIATGLSLNQLLYMKNRPTGFDRGQVVTVPLFGNSGKYELLKQELLANSLIQGVTASQDVLGSHLDQSGVGFKGDDGPQRDLTATRLIVDRDYLSLYKLQLLEGRNFSPEKSAEGKEYIINESLARELLGGDRQAELSSLLGKRFGFDTLGQIVGIARDFNFNSLHHRIETMFMFNTTEWGFSNMSVKINGDKPREALACIQSVWQKNCPGVPFDYEFLDAHFEELYEADAQVSAIVGALALLAILISCLGLFGLASYATAQRTREIGIRKVLGASVAGITGMLARDFLSLVVVSLFVAFPLAWYFMHRWLEDFAYRTDIQWWMFAAAGAAAIAIAFLTVSFQSVKAALANPVESLRSE